MQFKSQELVVDKFDALSLLTPDVCEVSLWKDGRLKATHKVMSVEEAEKLILSWDGEISLGYSGL
jgi:hypothetical protein